jgi:hypothetical protein
MEITRKFLAPLLVVAFLASVVPAPVQASTPETDGDDAAIIFDLIILRPVGFIATVAGTVIFIGSLPVSVVTGSVGKAFNALVKEPVKYTFWRTLGDERAD